MNPATIKDALGPKREEPFYKRINLWEIADATCIGADLEMSQGFELVRLPDTLLMETEEQEQYLATLKQMLHSIPENVTLQFILRAREGNPEIIGKYKKASLGKDDLSCFIRSERARHLTEKFTQRKRVFLFFTTRSKGETLKAAMFSLRGFLIPSRNGQDISELRTEHERRLRELKEIESSLLASLAQLGIEARKLDDRQLAEFFFEHLNPRRARDPKTSFIEATDSRSTTRSLLALSACESDFPGVYLDGTYHRTLSLVNVPDHMDVPDLPGFLLQLWPDYDLCVSVHVIDNSGTISKLKFSGNISRAIGVSGESGSKDYAAIQKHGEIDELLTTLQETTQKLFSVSFSVLVKGESEAEAERKTRLTLAAFREMGEAEGLIEDMNHLNIFLATLPNHTKLMRRRHPIHSRPLCHLLPLSAAWKGVDE